MAIKRIEIYTCDKCGDECQREDSYRSVHYDYYHDVGYSQVKAGFSWNESYGISGGSLCSSCVDDAILKLAASITEERKPEAAEKHKGDTEF